jgi:hypothetical protein
LIRDPKNRATHTASRNPATICPSAKSPKPTHNTTHEILFSIMIMFTLFPPTIAIVSARRHESLECLSILAIQSEKRCRIFRKGMGLPSDFSKLAQLGWGCRVCPEHTFVWGPIRNGWPIYALALNRVLCRFQRPMTATQNQLVPAGELRSRVFQCPAGQRRAESA